MSNTVPFQAPESLSEQIARHIGKQIITGELESKSRIQEIKICDELGVSRGPVREALLILERRHLVDILPRKGAMVSSLTAHHVNALYAFYTSLLKMLAATLAEKWTDFEMLGPLLDRIAEMMKQQVETEEDIQTFQESGFQLMHEAAVLVDNPYLLETLENLRPAIHRTYYLSMKVRNDAVQNSRNFFNQIAKGVTGRDQQLLIESVHEFADNQRKIVLQAL